MSRVLGAGLLVLGATLAAPAAARVESASPYAKSQVYSAALRYLRVDLGYEVTEKDPDAAYLMFRFSPEGRKTSASGSIQIVERQEGVRLVVQLPELPRYHEQVLAEGLQKKLASEYGEPPRKPDPPPKDRSDDKDKDKDKDGADKDDKGDKPRRDDSNE